MQIFWVLYILYYLFYGINSLCASNQFDSSGVCIPCDITCLQCDGASSSNCITSCSSTRQLDTGTGTCDCKDGYVENSPVAADCVALSCNYKCQTCNNTATYCTGACPSGANRVATSVGGTCPCLYKFFDNGVTNCVGCHYSCQQCTTAASNGCSSCNSANYRQTDGSGGCKCMAKYYDGGSNQLCNSCSYKCKTCQTSASNCLTCGDNRQTAPSCACVNKFYDDGSSQACIACHYTCATCTSGSSCTSCSSSTAFRQLVGSTPYCFCLDRYYQSNVYICHSCHPTCFQCTSGNANTDCTACSTIANRQLNSGKCICKDGYFETSATVELCGTCNYRCLTCSTTTATCNTCNSTLNRGLIGNTCPCIDGYYQSTTTGLCTLCHSSCQTCTNGTQCATCDTTVKLYSLNSSNLCSCDDIYYFNTTQQKCIACNYACKTCDQTSPIICLTCDTNRSYNSTSKTCPCLPLYYDSGAAACSPCHYSCLTCNGISATNCLTCPSSSFRTLNPGNSSCGCNTKYGDIGTVICVACHYTCQQCTTGASNGCSSCNTAKFRTTDGSNGCKCMDKYYNSGTNQLCVACNYKCKTCITSSTNCLVCGDNRQIAPSCACANKFYDDGSSQACLACHFSCLTCSMISKCDTCEGTTAFRQLINTSPYCSCLDRYYESNIYVCNACHATCFQCTTSNANNACTNCSATSFRQLSGSTCVCKTGYFETSPTVQLCVACSYRCLTCSTSASDCDTCNSTLYRGLVGATCPCIDGYYQSTTTGLCTLCHSSCQTCTNGTQCATCDTTVKLYSLNSSNLCSCDDIYYFNTTQQKCVACNYACKTCDQTSPIICLSCDTNRALNSTTKTCPCLPYFYDSGVAVCSACHYSCDSCNGLTLSNCLTCSTSNYRISVPSSGKCNCQTGYYDDGSNRLCQACIYSCLTCTDGLTCTTCDSAKNRSTPASNCPCVSGYYQHTNKSCVKCAYYCLTCTSGVTCSTCNSPNRSLNATTLKCDCPSNYYDNGVSQTCFTCLPQCKTCTNSSKCTSCEISLFRTLTANLCPCIAKYYDSSGTCMPCLYHCATCTAASTCQTCNSTMKRVKDTTTNLCVCQSGYYDTGVELCQPCHFSCLNCSTTSTQCTACDTTVRTLNTGQCLCKTKFYDNNSTVLCSSCHYTCANCYNGTYCDTCSAAKFRTFDSLNVLCKCMDKYYDDLSNQLCKACSYKCQTCTNSSVCLTCDATKFRNTPASSCPCMQKYYDTGLSNQLCSACQYTCSTCTNGTQCATCDNTTNHRIYNSSTKICDCFTGFYNYGSNQLCLPCVYSCYTCTSSSSNCVTCNDNTTHRQFVSNTCPCQKRYYDQNLVPVCLTCQYTCQTCNDGLICATCDLAKFRQIWINDSLCHCMTGYFDDQTNNQTCKTCDLTCLTCTNATACETCDPARNRLLNASTQYDGSTSKFCMCNYGYYSPSNSSTCQLCHYSCQVCSGGTLSDCKFCDSSAHRYKSGTKCKCNGGYYDDGSNQLCLLCHISCATCTGPLDSQCKSCNSTTFYLASITTCFVTCPNYYFANVISMTCGACSSNCLKCLNGSVCTQCDTNYYLLMSDRKCYLSCPDGFYKNTPLKLCSNCPTGCKTCDSNINCFTCLQHYYLDFSLHLCFSCNQFCKDCLGPAQDQCTSCYQPSVFRSNKCRNLTCPYGQYVDSVLGCQLCSSLWLNSLTCNKTQAFLCIDTYKLQSGECKICSSVAGYHITPVTNTCSQICGDGKLFDYQCDDGNQLDGDGCSRNCIIQKGWICSTAGVGSKTSCSLQDPLNMFLKSIFKFSGKNIVNLYLMLSLPYRLSNGFIVSITDTNISDYVWSYKQNQQNLSDVVLTIQYFRNLQGKLVQVSYDTSIARLLFEQTNYQMQSNNQIQQKYTDQTQHRLLAASTVLFNAQLELTAFPPVFYYSNQDIQFFQKSKTIIYYMALALLIISLIIIPKKTHLHSITFTFIIAKVWLIFGLGIQKKVDWINYALQNIKSFAIIGGIQAGNCCYKVSDFYNYKSQLISNSLFVLIVWAATWVIEGLLIFVNKYVAKMHEILEYSNYFTVTIHLTLIFHVFYSSINSLYHYTIENPVDAFNTTLSIAISIFCLLMVILSWAATYYLKVPKPSSLVKQLSNQPAHNQKSIDQDRQDFQVRNKNLFTINNDPKYATISNISLISEQNQVQQEQNQNEKSSFQKKQQAQKFSILESIEQSLDDDQQDKRAKYISRMFFKWDYIKLYKYKTKDSKSKYFLPFTLTMLYIQALVIVFLAPYQKFYFIAVEGGLQIIYLFYIAFQRPFKSRFTNFRIGITSTIFIAMYGIMLYYLHLSKQTTYFHTGQKICLYLCMVLFGLNIIFCALQNLFSWSQEIWNVLQPCLIKLRLRGVTKVYDITTFHKTKEVISMQEIKDGATQKPQEQYDAFYMRMLKKEKINKKYRRQRKMKEGIYHPY